MKEPEIILTDLMATDAWIRALARHLVSDEDDASNDQLPPPEWILPPHQPYPLDDLGRSPGGDQNPETGVVGVPAVFPSSVLHADQGIQDGHEVPDGHRRRHVEFDRVAVSLRPQPENSIVDFIAATGPSDETHPVDSALGARGALDELDLDRLHRSRIARLRSGLLATLPFTLRSLVAYHPGLSAGVRRIFVTTVLDRLTERAAKLGLATGGGGGT